MGTFGTICVFCGSSDGAREGYRNCARQTGQLLALQGIDLVYGGGSVGLMGELADAALANGGRVVGVITRQLHEYGQGHSGVTRLEVVESMHERKARMAELADGFIGLPGGLGTLEEVFEALTWAQLSIHSKPIGLVNSGGFFDQLVAFVHHASTEGFIRPVHRELLQMADTPEELIVKLGRR